jgi:hypothetical protein
MAGCRRDNGWPDVRTIRADFYSDKAIEERRLSLDGFVASKLVACLPHWILYAEELKWVRSRVGIAWRWRAKLDDV